MTTEEHLALGDSILARLGRTDTQTRKRQMRKLFPRLPGQPDPKK